MLVVIDLYHGMGWEVQPEWASRGRRRENVVARGRNSRDNIHDEETPLEVDARGIEAEGHICQMWPSSILRQPIDRDCSSN